MIILKYAVTNIYYILLIIHLYVSDKYCNVEGRVVLLMLALM